jgi:predicted membrane-bound spermidine synthase
MKLCRFFVLIFRTDFSEYPRSPIIGHTYTTRTSISAISSLKTVGKRVHWPNEIREFITACGRAGISMAHKNQLYLRCKPTYVYESKNEFLNQHVLTIQYTHNQDTVTSVSKHLFVAKINARGFCGIHVDIATLLLSVCLYGSSKHVTLNANIFPD